jgi:hypothetical protein
MGEERGVYRVLAGFPEAKRPLGRPRRRWEDNIKMDLQEVVCGGTDWIDILLRCMFYLDAGLLASSQYPEGPALTGHLDTGFSWFPCV